MTEQANASRELETIFAELVGQSLAAEVCGVEALAPGLGNRRFFRLRLRYRGQDRGPDSVIARVEGIDDEAKRASGVAAEPPLEPLRAFFYENGIPVPRRYAGDELRGIDLLEDVGPYSLEHAVSEVDPARRVSLYRAACELIPKLQHLQDSGSKLPAFSRRLDRALISSKADRFIAWALPWHLDRPANAAEEKVVREAFGEIADACESAPLRLSHRDYKAANIHLRQPGDVPGACDELVLIDLQGAFMAPPEYDLVCLLRDSHVLLPTSEVAAHCRAIRPRLPDAPQQSEFDARFALLTLSRVAKDSAHYIHAATSAEDHRYIPFLPAAQATMLDAASKAASWSRSFERLGDLISSWKAQPADGYRETAQAIKAGP